MWNAFRSVRGKAFIGYWVRVFPPTVAVIVFVGIAVNPGAQVHRDFYSAVAQIVPVLLLADLVLFARSRRMFAKVLEANEEIAKLKEKGDELRAKSGDLEQESEALGSEIDDLRVEAARLGKLQPPRSSRGELAPLNREDEIDRDEPRIRLDLDAAAGVLDGAMSMTLVWAIAAGAGSLIALGSGTSSAVTLLPAIAGVLWLTVNLAIIELVSFRVSTSGKLSNAMI